MKKYDKLVRDRIPEIIKADGKECIVEVVDNKKKYELLERKLREYGKVIIPKNAIATCLKYFNT